MYKFYFVEKKKTYSGVSCLEFTPKFPGWYIPYSKQDKYVLYAFFLHFDYTCTDGETQCES